MSTELVMQFNHLILCRPLLLLPSIFPSSRVFSNESALYIRWPKYWSFSISPSSEYSGLISFRINQFDPLAVVLCLLQHHNLKPSVFLALCPLYHLAFLSWEPHEQLVLLLPSLCYLILYLQAISLFSKTQIRCGFPDPTPFTAMLMLCPFCQLLWDSMLTPILTHHICRIICWLFIGTIKLIHLLVPWRQK